MREIVQLGFIKEILTEYSDDLPLHHFLKEFFKKHRQFGSRDRRFYSDTIYKYLRCKTLFSSLPFEEKLCYSGFLTTTEPSGFYRYLVELRKMELPLYAHWAESTDTKLDLLLNETRISWQNYFPAQSSVSGQIDRQHFFRSHLLQPKLFIRTRRTFISEIIQKLNDVQLEFEQIGDAFAFSSQPDLAKVLPEGGYEVQDLSSQRTLELFNGIGDMNVWDCCSGAGGKSLMLKDAFPSLEIFCSDRRAEIIVNLVQRFHSAKLEPAGTSVYDAVKGSAPLTFAGKLIPQEFFDCIVADVPCSGSGTWGRTPERLNQFKKEEIETYVSLQRGIVANALRYLKPGGTLVYITCSVFEEENEKNTMHLAKLGLQLIHQKYFTGYGEGADTMYGAVLKKTS
jgi:16S rRNA (cytosine967-C5)-methyltransferase